ncbi:Uncharacterised protein [Vibrio cholerae]|uniref:Uncharacterized protein n=1 Tax=Vibrio cholerae TaxID=666 RepID=A0A655ZYK7_VIBCL|nr:Uncharacterised protein [Vibrio cholerae]
MSQREIFVFQMLHITQHLSFTVVCVKHRVSQKRALTTATFWNRGELIGRNAVGKCMNLFFNTKDRKERFNVSHCRGFIKAHTKLIRQFTQVDVRLLRSLVQSIGFCTCIDRQRIKEMLMRQFVTRFG